MLLFEDRRPDKNKNNKKTSSDMESVPDPKIYKMSEGLNN